MNFSPDTTPCCTAVNTQPRASKEKSGRFKCLSVWGKTTYLKEPDLLLSWKQGRMNVHTLAKKYPTVPTFFFLYSTSKKGRMLSETLLKPHVFICTDSTGNKWQYIYTVFCNINAWKDSFPTSRTGKVVECSSCLRRSTGKLVHR